MNTLLGSLTLVEIECCNCITHFAMDRALYDRCQESGRTFYCPNGHGQSFTETELSRLRKETVSLKKQRDWAEDAYQREHQQHVETKREKANVKRQLTITRKRVANGVCPECHRTFQQLSRHMESKHPHFKEVVG